MLDTTLSPLHVPDELAAKAASSPDSSSTWDGLKLVGFIAGGAAVGIAAFAAMSQDGLGLYVRTVLEMSSVEWIQFLALATGAVLVVGVRIGCA